MIFSVFVLVLVFKKYFMIEEISLNENRNHPNKKPILEKSKLLHSYFLSQSDKS